MALYRAHPAHPTLRLGQPAMSRRSLLAGAAAAVAAGPMFLSGCGGSDKADGKSARVLDEVTYITATGKTGREAFAWVASAKGFFAEEGLKVNIVPGAGGEENLKMLAAGKAQFVQIDYAGAVVRVGEGNFDQFRVISVLNNRTLIAIMVLTSSGISTPKDLAGKTVAQMKGSVVKTLFPAYADLAKIDRNAVTWHEVQPTALPSLLIAGKADGVGQFIPGKPGIRAASKGQDITVLPYSDYMSDLYGNVLIARTDTDTDLKRRFARALHKGLHHAVNNLEEAGKIFHAAVPTVSENVAAAELDLLKPYVGAPEADSNLVARSISLLQAINLYPPGTPVPERVFDFDIMGDAASKANAGATR